MFNTLIFIGGKGGVGKSTLAAALASQLSQTKKVLLISTDPAHNLKDIFQTPFGSEIFSLTPTLDVLEIDGEHEVKTYLDQVAAKTREMASPDSYGSIDQYFSSMAQSAHATDAALFDKLASLATSNHGYDHLVIDTAPTGHTLRFFFMPKMLKQWAHHLLKNQKDAAFIEGAIGHLSPELAKTDRQTYMRRSMHALIEARYLKFAAFEQLIRFHTDIVFVLNPEKLPVEETRRARESLQEKRLDFKALLINKVLPEGLHDGFMKARLENQNQALALIDEVFAQVPKVHLPLKEKDILDRQTLQSLGEAIITGLQAQKA